MNINISGSGVIPAGEYEKISTSGSAKLFGTVKCTAFSSSGSVKGESIECSEIIKTSGSAKFSGNVKAKSLSTSGSFLCSDNISVSEKISCSGSFKCDESLKCNKLSQSGKLIVNGNIEAESISASGKLICRGLVNAGTLDAGCSRLNVNNIGGSKISITLGWFNRAIKKIPLISRLVRNAVIKNSVEGDEISVEYIDCPRVIGKNVKIGFGCRIDLVEYTESIEISRFARIGKVQKIKL